MGPKSNNKPVGVNYKNSVDYFKSFTSIKISAVYFDSLLSPKPKYDFTTCNAAIPFITTFLATYSNIISRKDTDLGVRNEDWAIGFELISTSMLIILVYSFTVAISNPASGVEESSITALETRLSSTGWLLFAYFWINSFVTTYVRIFGWKTSSAGNATLDTVKGVIVPNIIGIACLIYSISWIN